MKGHIYIKVKVDRVELRYGCMVVTGVISYKPSMRACAGDMPWQRCSFSIEVSRTLFEVFVEMPQRDSNA